MKKRKWKISPSEIDEEKCKIFIELQKLLKNHPIFELDKYASHKYYPDKFELTIRLFPREN